MERSLFVLLPRLPLRLWLGVEMIDAGRDREELPPAWPWYKEVPDL
jgi:hypothetical protein